MATYSKILELISAVPRTVDLSTNTLSVQGLQINAATGGGSFTQAAHSTTTTYSVVWPAAQAGGSNYVLANDGSGNLSWIASASGSVTSVSVNTANGFAGTSSGGSTPALTLTTTITGLLKGNGTAISAAVAGTDYVIPSGSITGTASNITASSNSTLTTLSALSLPTSQLSGTITAAQMLPLATNDIYVGNGSNQPAAVAMSGDATIASSGALTLATVATAGTTGSSTSIPSITINVKGLVTSVTGNAVVAPAGTLSGTTLNSTVTASSLTSLGTQAQALNMGSNQINGLAAPSTSTDAATKGYVDAAISGLTWQGPAKAYAASNVPLTGGATLTIDGYSVQNGDLVILGNQTVATTSGEYTASGIGTAYVLTSNGLPTAIGDAWLILNGTVYADSAFVANHVFGSSSTPMFTEFAGPTSYTFNAPLSLSGNTVSITQSNTSTNGYLSSTDWNTFNGKQAAGNYITALTGDATASGPGSAALTLATVNSNTGTFASVTVNGKGLVTAAAALSGDATTSGSVLTLATVATAGTTGSSTSIPAVTINAKGLVTSITGNAVVAPAGTLSGTTLNSTVVSSSLTSVGTITSGTWTGTTIAIANGGTGQTTKSAAFNALSPITATGDLIVGNGSNSATNLAIGSTGQVLTVSGGTAAWATPSTVSTATTTTETSDQSLTASTLYALRYALSTDGGSTVGRMWKADNNAATTDNFYVIGLAYPGSGVSQGQSVTVTEFGIINVPSHGFTTGAPLYLGSSGACTSTAPSSSGLAIVRVGQVKDANNIWVDAQVVGVN